MEQGFVFTTQYGSPLGGVDLTKRLKKVLAAAVLPDMRWHHLRHACASLLLAETIPARIIMDTLGHSQISLTMRYSHVIPELQADAARSVERVLSGEDDG